MTVFQTSMDVQMKHCDAAGIVFLPRYFEMVHTVIEHWFDEALDWPMSQILGNGGLSIPLRQVQAEFPTPSRLGDVLNWRLEVTKIGATSMDLGITAATPRGGDHHMRCSGQLVLVETGVMRVRNWPSAVRARAESYLVKSPAGSATAP